MVDAAALSTVEWVFAYGSLMWNPGFAYTDRQPAMLDGFHRAFCIYSHHYRGTPAKPGLVLGLDKGGSCRGIALRFAPDTRDAVVAYLNERELIGYAYRPAIVTATLEAGQPVAAYTFVTDPTHPQYAGDLGPARDDPVFAPGDQRRPEARMRLQPAGEIGMRAGKAPDRQEQEGRRRQQRQHDAEPAQHDAAVAENQIEGLGEGSHDGARTG